MDCRDAAERITALVDGELPAGERAALESHLAGCPACRRTRGEEEATVARLRALGRPPLPAGFREGVMARVRAAGSPGSPAPVLRLRGWPWIAAAAMAAGVLAMVLVGREEGGPAERRVADASPAAGPPPAPAGVPAPAPAKDGDLGRGRVEAEARERVKVAEDAREEKPGAPAGAKSEAAEAEKREGEGGTGGAARDEAASKSRAPGPDPAAGGEASPEAPARPAAPAEGKDRGRKMGAEARAVDKPADEDAAAGTPAPPDAPAEKKKRSAADRLEELARSDVTRVVLFLEAETAAEGVLAVEEALRLAKDPRLERVWLSEDDLRRQAGRKGTDSWDRADAGPGQSTAGGAAAGAAASEAGLVAPAPEERVARLRLPATSFGRFREALVASGALRESGYAVVGPSEGTAGSGPAAGGGAAAPAAGGERRSREEEEAQRRALEETAELDRLARATAKAPAPVPPAGPAPAPGEPVPPPKPTEEQLRRLREPPAPSTPGLLDGKAADVVLELRVRGNPAAPPAAPRRPAPAKPPQTTPK